MYIMMTLTAWLRYFFYFLEVSYYYVILFLRPEQATLSSFNQNYALIF